MSQIQDFQAVGARVSLNQCQSHASSSDRGIRNRLDTKQAEELKGLNTLLPRIVQTLERNEKDRKSEKQKESPKTVKSSRKRPDVGEKEDFSEFIEHAETDASSQDTIIDLEKDYLEDKNTKNTKKRVKFVEDDDRSSVSSFEQKDR